MTQPELTPYDTGERCEPKPWFVYGTPLSAQSPAADFGKVDFEDDEGATVVVVHVERTAAGHRVVIEPMSDLDDIEVELRR